MRKKILIVDDELLMLSCLEKALRDEHTEVKAVQSDRQAMEAVNSCFYNLCILDICLQDVNGFELMKAIKEMSPETLVLLMSGNDYSDIIEKEQLLFIPKPFELYFMKTFVKQLLKNPDKLFAIPTQNSSTDI